MSPEAYYASKYGTLGALLGFAGLSAHEIARYLTRRRLLGRYAPLLFIVPAILGAAGGALYGAVLRAQTTRALRRALSRARLHKIKKGYVDPQHLRYIVRSEIGRL
ncbi:MAG: hypothetical protein QXO15_09760 [Nitrososphaerota archaeon]